MCRRSFALVVAPLLASAVAALAGPAPASADLPAPVAAGDSAANIDLSSAGRRVMVRWVARATGTLAALHLRIQADGSSCRLSGRTGYGLGNGGSWHVTTHPVLPDGRPDQSQTLSTYDFRPCTATTDVADVRQGVVRVPMSLAVTKGAEYATVIANGDPSPSQNYTSTNFLYTSAGIIGANGRNERSATAPDAYYGLDPRELVGYSRDGGQTWDLPGGPYGKSSGRCFLPTYLQEYAGGQIMGQPYYYASGSTTAGRTMVFSNIHENWTIRELGAYTSVAGSGTLSMTVDGRQVASAPVSGVGMLRAAIDPVTVTPGQTVRVTATGVSIKDIVADTAWGRLMGMHLATTPWKVENEPNFSHAAPVYPLPAYGTPEAEQPVAPAVAAPPPADPPPAADPSPTDPPPAAAPPPTDPPPAADPPPADPPPAADPPPTDPPPAANPPHADPPPAADPPPTDPPPADPPPASDPPTVVFPPPVVAPPIESPPVAKPPVVAPPVVKPPAAKSPVPKPPAKPPRPKRHKPRRPAPSPCRKAARGRGKAALSKRRSHRAQPARCRPQRVTSFQGAR